MFLGSHPPEFILFQRSRCGIDNRGGDNMSDNVIILMLALICVTVLGLTAMVLIGTYFKDKLTLKGKSSIGNITENEISITAEDKNSKK